MFVAAGGRLAGKNNFNVCYVNIFSIFFFFVGCCNLSLYLVWDHTLKKNYLFIFFTVVAYKEFIRVL